MKCRHLLRNRGRSYCAVKKCQPQTTPLVEVTADDCRQCPCVPKAVVAEPTRVQKAVTYAKAVVKWVAHKCPIRSDEETQGIFKVFCKPCSHLIGGNCRLCGCRANQSKVALLNKIKMGTEHCPKGKW